MFNGLKNYVSRLSVIAILLLPSVVSPLGAGLAHAESQWPKLVSISADGQPGDLTSADSGSHAIQVSKDGRYVAFLSQSTNLGVSAPAGEPVYIRDMQDDTTVVGSIGAQGQVVSPSQSDFWLSGNGRYLAFNSAGGIDVRDLSSNITTHVSVTGGGYHPSLSDDGSVVAYSFRAGNQDYIEVQNLTTGQVWGLHGDHGESPLVTGDGRYITYTSSCCSSQVKRYDTAADTFTTVSGAADGTPGNASSNLHAISGDGRYVLFYTSASNLSSDGQAGTYRKDMQTGELVPFTGGDSGPTENLSYDGDTIVYNGDCSTPDSVGTVAVCLYHFSTGQFQAVSRNQWGAVSDAVGGTTPAINQDGIFVAFSTWSNSEYGVQNASSMQVFAEPTNGFPTLDDHIAPTLGSVNTAPGTINSGSSSTLSATVSDTGSGVRKGEYFIGTDPGNGKGTSMDISDGIASATLYSCDTGGPAPQALQARSINNGLASSAAQCTIGVRAMDNAGNWSSVSTATLAVGPPPSAPTITSDATYSTAMRQIADFMVTTSGTPTASISETGALPDGVTLTDNGDGTASFTGEAAVGTAGDYPITITASNGTSRPATQDFVLTVTTATSAPGFLSANSDTETYGVPFSFTVVTTGYPAPNISKNVTVPAGLSFTDNGDGTATISGTPAASAVGVKTITWKAHNSLGTATQAFTLTITNVPVFKNISPSSATGAVGTPFSLVVTAKGFSVPAITKAGALPGGLSFADNGNGTATFAGTPVVGSGGAYPVTLTATNSNGTTTKAFSLFVNEAPQITSSVAVTATVGAAMSFSVTTSGYPAPKLAMTGTLPAGLIFRAGAGTLSGTPRAGTAGTYPLTLTAENSTGIATQHVVLTVQ